jgi:hypothetical protein
MTNSYTCDPQISLANPTATSISMRDVTVTFADLQVLYKGRTFQIPTPEKPTWFYVTIADPSQQGESTDSLVATCQTSDALVGMPGHTYIGAIKATPAGGSINALAGGWPSPPTFIVGGE